MNKIAICLIIFFSILSTVSCRKGENDPFLSLRSRKARITGGWNLSEGTYSYNSPGVFDLKINYDGEKAEEYVDGSLSKTYDYRVRMTIKKDFTYERITHENGFDKTEAGNWFFTKKSKQLGLKNKEAIVLSVSSITNGGITTTYTGTNADELLLIDRLKNNEVLFKGERTNTTTVTDTEKYDYTYLKI